jgi:hypothetical protein
MAKWRCPNKAKVAGHSEKILFSDEKMAPSGEVVPYLQVPKPAYCEICDRYYTRDECVEVGL